MQTPIHKTLHLCSTTQNMPDNQDGSQHIEVPPTIQPVSTVTAPITGSPEVPVVPAVPTQSSRHQCVIDIDESSPEPATNPMDYPVSRKCPKLLTKSELNQRASTNRRTNPDSLPIITDEKFPKVFNVTDVSPHKEKEIANGDEKTQARGPGPSPYANPCKPPLGLLPESDLNNSGFLGEDSAPLLKNPKSEKAQKPRSPRKAKDAPKRKPNIEDDFEALQESKGYWRGLIKLDPNFKHYKLIYDACHGKLDDGVKKAEKKFKDLEDYLSKK